METGQVLKVKRIFQFSAQESEKDITRSGGKLPAVSDVKLSFCKVEPGKADKLRSWYRKLEERSKEVEKSLEHEDMFTETAFIQDHGQDTYLYVYMESEDMEDAENSGDKEKFDIDQEHHEVLEECLKGEWRKLETIGHMVNPDR